MALPGKRLRANDAFGSISDNPLTAGSATFNSTQLVYIPVVSGDHLVITLDPLRQHGDPEIVVVTNHAAAATVATVTRGAYGTTPRSHPQGTIWVHAAVDEDFVAVVTIATRPTNPYEGQPIYETDSKKLVVYSGAAWVSRDAGGQVDFKVATVAQTGLGAGPTDITGLSSTISYPANRRIKVTGYAEISSNTADDSWKLVIADGANNQLAEAVIITRLANVGVVAPCMYVTTPGAGPNTFKLRVGRIIGGGTGQVGGFGASSPMFLLIEDMGAA